MSIESINRRLDKLDALRPAVSPRHVIRLIVEEDEETPDQAIARWCAEHPDQPPPDSAADFIILRSLVSRNGRPRRRLSLNQLHQSTSLRLWRLHTKRRDSGCRHGCSQDLNGALRR